MNHYTTNKYSSYRTGKKPVHWTLNGTIFRKKVLNYPLTFRNAELPVIYSYQNPMKTDIIQNKFSFTTRPDIELTSSFKTVSFAGKINQFPIEFATKFPVQNRICKTSRKSDAGIINENFPDFREKSHFPGQLRFHFRLSLISRQ